jgi:ZipA, C-terminal FtsZ-binding domain
LRHGFVPGVVPGRLILPSAAEGAPAVLALSFDSQAALAEDPNQTAVRDLTLAFDVPQTEQSGAPFAAWRSSALALSRDMDAVVADDNGQALDESAFTQIDAELARLYEALQARDLAAGSPAARRLFS